MDKILTSEEGEAVRERVLARIRAANVDPTTGERRKDFLRYEGVDVPDSWLGILDRLDKSIAEICPEYYVNQAKEKFAMLRYYVANIPEETRPAVDLLIEAAETESARTCQECGHEGHVGKAGFRMITLCPEHGKARKNWEAR